MVRGTQHVISTRVPVASGMAGRYSGDDHTGWHVLGHYRTGANSRSGTNHHTAEDSRVRADRHSLADMGTLQCPIGTSLRTSVHRGCPRILVVREHDAMSDENLVIN